MAGSGGFYGRDVDTLERELGIVDDTFRGLSEAEWAPAPCCSHRPRAGALDPSGAGRPLRHLDRADPRADRRAAGRAAGP
jgi:hypothetical protein